MKKVIGIYLAAGKSTRFPGNKLQAQIKGRSLGSIGLKEALRSDLDFVIVVVQPEDCMSWLPLTIRETYANKLLISACENSVTGGQSASLQHGLHIAEQLNADAILILLADQPFITDHLLNQYLRIYKQTKNYTCILSEHSYISPPLLIDSALFRQIDTLEGDQGARQIIKEQRACCYFLPTKDNQVFVDIDTKADLHHWFPKKTHERKLVE